MTLNEFLIKNPGKIEGVFTKLFGQYFIRYYGEKTDGYTVEFSYTEDTSYNNSGSKMIVVAMKNVILLLQSGVNVLAIAYHELGHSLKTDFLETQQIINHVVNYIYPHPTSDMEKIHAIWNILEDERMERRMVKDFKFLAPILEPLRTCVTPDGKLMSWRHGDTEGVPQDIINWAEEFVKGNASIYRKADAIGKIITNYYPDGVEMPQAYQIKKIRQAKNGEVGEVSREVVYETKDSKENENEENQEETTSKPQPKPNEEEKEEESKGEQTEPETESEPNEDEPQPDQDQPQPLAGDEKDDANSEEDENDGDETEENNNEGEGEGEDNIGEDGSPQDLELEEPLSEDDISGGEILEDEDENESEKEEYEDENESKNLSAQEEKAKAKEDSKSIDDIMVMPEEEVIKSILQNNQKSILEQIERKAYNEAVKPESPPISQSYYGKRIRKLENYYNAKADIQKGMTAAKTKAYSSNISSRVSVSRVIEAQASRQEPKVFYGKGKDTSFLRKVVIFEDVSGSTNENTQDYNHITIVTKIFSQIAYALSKSFEQVEWWSYGNYLQIKSKLDYDLPTYLTAHRQGNEEVGFGTSTESLLSVMTRYRSQDNIYVIITDGDMNEMFNDNNADTFKIFQNKTAVVGFISNDIQRKFPFHADIFLELSHEIARINRLNDEAGYKKESFNKSREQKIVVNAVKKVIDIIQKRIR